MHLLRVLTHADFTRYNIHLALTRDGGNYEVRLPKAVQVHYLTKGGYSSITALLKSYNPLKQLIAELQPKAVISVMDPQNLLLSYIRKTDKNAPPVILMCQNAPIKNLSNEGLRGKLYLYLIPRWYNFASKIIAICDGVRQELQSKLAIKAPTTVIYNAGFDDPGYQTRKGEPLDPSVSRGKNQLVSCGRLIKQKGFDVLIEALGLIKDTTDFNLWILGEGDDKEKLIALRNAKGLTDRVHFLGFRTNPYQFFANADVFVLSSRWEGFGNVITEAMICGCAAISTECDFGPNEIITHQKDGLLCEVDNPGSLARAITQMITDTALQKHLREAGEKRAAVFSSIEISRQYMAEIERTYTNA